jgi:O-antigen/teichoic acid export membrane protein
MASLGYGYWARVSWPAASALVGMILAWILSGWRPGLPRRGCGVRSMLAFGGFLSGANILTYVRRNIDNVLIGSFFGPDSLGLYQKAYQILMLPIQQANQPLTNVILPVLSRLSTDHERYKRVYKYSLLIMVSFGSPIAGFMFIAANDVVLFALGPHWSDCVPLFMALSPAAAAATLHSAAGWVFVSTGRTDRLLFTGIISTIAIVIAIIIGLQWGPLGVAIAFSLVYCAERMPIIWYSLRGTQLRILDVCHVIWLPLCGTLLSCLVTVLLSAYWANQALPLRLTFSAITFTISHGLSWGMLPGGRDELWFMYTLIRYRGAIQ